MKLSGLRERIQKCKTVEEVELCLKETENKSHASNRTKKSWISTARKTLRNLTEQPIVPLVKKKVDSKKK
jgi:hypothetical protein